jgi:DNA-binding NtrC family response regulator
MVRSDRVLVVEDHPDLREFASGVLEHAGYSVVAVGSLAAAEAELGTATVDVVVTDLKLPEGSGLDVLAAARRIDPDAFVIFVTGFPSVETAVMAMKFGAADYLLKPFSAPQLLAVVEAGLEKRRAKEVHGLLRREARSAFDVQGILGGSRPMLSLFEDIRRAAAVDAGVLILGESGAGKERVAHAIHDNSSRRAGPFVPINCAAIPDNLLEAELFGYERGAFTGAHVMKQGLLQEADGGTVFLDEVCELNPALQAKLLRALEDGTARRLGGRSAVRFDVRFMAATNGNIREAMRQGRFREDLFFRLNVIEIHVPPLRERREDIPLLAAYFLDVCGRRRRTKIEGITPAAMRVLIGYDWPGNVRELKNAVERAAAYATGDFIIPDDLPITVKSAGDGAGTFRTWRDKAFARLERDFVVKALGEHAGNVSRAARALGLHRSTLQRVMRRHDVPPAPAVPPRPPMRERRATG